MAAKSQKNKVLKNERKKYKVKRLEELPPKLDRGIVKLEDWLIYEGEV
ncbi:MAG TPA: hypothetical protein VLB50_02075 [Ignavibacteriaceae bacterium]|nr:hypothetical protein [Ignavibacteriaceae bacterium]